MARSIDLRAFCGTISGTRGWSSATFIVSSLDGLDYGLQWKVRKIKIAHIVNLFIYYDDSTSATIMIIILNRLVLHSSSVVSTMCPIPHDAQESPTSGMHSKWPHRRHFSWSQRSHSIGASAASSSVVGGWASPHTLQMLMAAVAMMRKGVMVGLSGFFVCVLCNRFVQLLSLFFLTMWNSAQHNYMCMI